MNAPARISHPARDAGKVELAGGPIAHKVAVAKELLDAWLRDTLAQAIRPSSADEFNENMAIYRLGKLTADLFCGELPEWAETAADHLRVYFNYCPDEGGVFDSGALGGRDGFDLGEEQNDV